MKKYIQTSSAITRKHGCFLSKISRDAKFSGGKKFSRSAILRTLIVTIMKIDIDVKSIKSEKELGCCFKTAFKKFDPTTKRKRQRLEGNNLIA